MIEPTFIGLCAIFTVGLAMGVLIEPSIRLGSCGLGALRGRNRLQHAAQIRLTADTDSVPVSTVETVEPAAVAPSMPARAERADLPIWCTAEQHAAALLDWLQSPGGLAGEIAATEVASIYREMCGEMRWAARPWAPVAKELRMLLGGDKSYAWREGHRVRVYRIPACDSVLDRVPLRRAA